MFHPLIVYIAISTLPFSVLTQDIWIYPKPNTNPTFSQSDTLSASWASDFHFPYLTLWCGFASDELPPPINLSAPASGSALVPLNYNFTGEIPCHLNLQEVGLPWPGGSLNSPNFNILPQEQQGVHPITWNSNSDSGPTTFTTSTTTTSSDALTTPKEPLATVTVLGSTRGTAFPVTSIKTVFDTQPTEIPDSVAREPVPLSKPAAIGVIIGATIAALFFILGIVLIVRARRNGAKRLGSVASITIPDQTVGRDVGNSKSLWHFQQTEEKELTGESRGPAEVESEAERGRWEIAG